MQLKNQVDSIFRPLIGQKAWGASLGVGSFVTIKFGKRLLEQRHYHGEWHLWLYLCEWNLYSGARLTAHSESKRKVMQLAIRNLDGAALKSLSFDPQLMITRFAFDPDLHLECKP